MFKKAVQQGRRAFGARSVHGVREHAKSPRTQLAAFFNIPLKGSEDLATSSAPAVDPSNLGQAPTACGDFCDPTAASRFNDGPKIGCEMSKLLSLRFLRAELYAVDPNLSHGTVEYFTSIANKGS